MVVLKEVNNMFWALTLEAGKRYTQKVEKAFHLSMAALEDTQKKGGDGMVSVMISTDKAEFLLCCLRHKHVHNQALDLNFTEGEDVTFFINGEGTIHLSGYQLEEEEPYDFDSHDEMDEESETDEVPELVSGKGTKRKMVNSKNIAAKLKKLKQLDEDSDDEDSDEDSDDEGLIDPRMFLDGEANSEDDEDDEDFDDEFIDDDDDDDDEEEEEEEEEEIKPQKKVQKKETKQVNTPKSEKKNKKKESATPAQEKKQVQESGDATESAKKKKKKKKNKNKDKESPEKTPQEQKQPDKKQNQSKTPNKQEKPAQSKTPNKQEKPAQSKTPKKQVLQGGIVMEEFNFGAGPSVQKGKMAHVYYVGKLQKDGKQFDSCTSGKPFKFRLGANEVISGWDKGVQGMKVGSKRRLIVPPKEGYGNQKQGPIPANSTLIFDIELKSIS